MRSPAVLMGGFQIQTTRPTRSSSQAARNERTVRSHSSKGFGKQEPATKPRKKAGKNNENLPVQSEESLEPKELLKEFHLSPDKEAVAAKYAASLTEKFFVIADAMLNLAIKEGETTVQSEYTRILQAAMSERQKSLRPEIRLLNELMMGSTLPDERRERISSSEAAEVLVMNDRYFFTLLAGMKKDLRDRGGSKDQADVQALLDDIEMDCRGRAEAFEVSGK